MEPFRMGVLWGVRVGGRLIVFESYSAAWDWIDAQTG